MNTSTAKNINNKIIGSGELGSAERFLFNEQNLLKYEVSAMHGLSLVHKAIRKNQKPFSGISPKELATEFASIDLDQPLNSIDATLEEVEQLYLDHAVYFHHPKYVAHLNCPVVYPAVLAEQILTSVNTSVDTWDQSGGATLIEQKLIDWTLQRIGMEEGADGIFTSGGTQSNLMAMLIARDNAAGRRLNHSIRDDGLPEEAHKYRIFTSQVSHFSVQKSAALLGLGYNSVVSVPCDSHFKMDTVELTRLIEQAIDRGEIPIAVVATMGTTDFGSIDPIQQIKPICEQYNLWCHVDAAYGCGLLTSNHSRHLLDGIESADSVTVDYHKSFMQPVSCSAFFLKDKSYFEYITHHADYLNPLNSDVASVPNLVDKSIQTTRRFDALKLWMTLRTMGVNQLGSLFDSVMALAKQSFVYLNDDPEFDVIHNPQLSTLVFRLLIDGASEQELNTINTKIKDRIFASGEAAIARTKFNGRQYLKFTLLNPATSMDEIKAITAQIKSVGHEIWQEIIAPQSSSTSNGEPK